MLKLNPEYELKLYVAAVKPLQLNPEYELNLYVAAEHAHSLKP